jgi:fungal type III polyketide synthase
LSRASFLIASRLEKVLYINEFTGIETRSTIATINHPLANRAEPPTIGELSKIFLDYGVQLSVEACRKAVADWGGDLSDLTHIVSVTCTNSANPGFDHYVVKQLGLNTSIEKVLLHGVGCSGGLAALRTAANIAQGASFRRKPARVLVLACEITSLLVRSELESIAKLQETRIGVTLFSDCASAVVLGNGFGDDGMEEPILELLGWDHRIIDDTEDDLGFDVDPLGNSPLVSDLELAANVNRLEGHPLPSSTKARFCLRRTRLHRSRHLNTGTDRCRQSQCH